MKKSKKFEPGDLIAVAGGEIGKDGKVANTATVAIVAAVGLSDLIVYTDEIHRTIHKVPKAICSEISINAATISEASIAEPELGDLVLSYTHRTFSKDPPKVVTGVLYKVTYRMGSPHVATLMAGTDFEEVPYDSILLLQKSSGR